MHKRDIHSYWGWAGPASAIVSRVFRVLGAIARSPLKPPFSALMRCFAKSDGSGPDANLRERSSSYVSAAAYDARGAKLASAQMGDSDGFTFTAEILAWSAQAIARGELLQTGVTGPVQAFGRERLRKGHAESGFDIE